MAKENTFRDLLVEKLGDAAWWIAGVLLAIIYACWALIRPLVGLAIIVFGILGWSFISYYIIWWLVDDTTTRVWLLVFSVFIPIAFFASNNPIVWLTARQQAQAEYLADLLDKKQRQREQEEKS